MKQSRPSHTAEAQTHQGSSTHEIWSKNSLLAMRGVGLKCGPPSPIRDLLRKQVQHRTEDQMWQRGRGAWSQNTGMRMSPLDRTGSLLLPPKAPSNPEPQQVTLLRNRVFADVTS